MLGGGVFTIKYNDVDSDRNVQPGLGSFEPAKDQLDGAQSGQKERVKYDEPCAEGAPLGAVDRVFAATRRHRPQLADEFSPIWRLWLTAQYESVDGGAPATCEE